MDSSLSLCVCFVQTKRIQRSGWCQAVQIFYMWLQPLCAVLVSFSPNSYCLYLCSTLILSEFSTKKKKSAFYLNYIIIICLLIFLVGISPLRRLFPLRLIDYLALKCFGRRKKKRLDLWQWSTGNGACFFSVSLSTLCSFWRRKKQHIYYTHIYIPKMVGRCRCVGEWPFLLNIICPINRIDAVSICVSTTLFMLSTALHLILMRKIISFVCVCVFLALSMVPYLAGIFCGIVKHFIIAH